MPDLVQLERSGAVATIWLNRPEKLNAMSTEMVEVLSTVVDAVGRDPSVRVVVIGGRGRSFCAGYDLEEDSGADVSAAHATLAHDLRRLMEVFDLPKPVIARVHGHCLAGGCDLMMMCDLAVASEDAVFGVPELKFGSAVVAMVMPWLIGARRAKELLLTGEDRLPAVEAERIGLVNRVVPADRLDHEVAALAKRLAVVDPVAMSLTKRAINAQWEAAGFRPALQAAVSLGAVVESADVPEREEFDRIRRERGLGDAIAWRDDRFT
jgi:enoyl-CoA hydratase